jgi:hypothetical protein
MGSMPMRRMRWCSLAVATILAACSAKAPAPQPDPTGPVPPLPPPPPSCAKDGDCVPANCCYALAADACVPAAKASCDAVKIDCLPVSDLVYSCGCIAGACVGKPGTTPPPARPAASVAPSNAGDTWVQGDLDAPSVLKVVMAHAADVKFCQAAARRPSGMITLAWDIAPAGSVPKVVVMISTVKSPALEKCLTAKVKGWRFPARKGTSQATYSFQFASAK